MSDKIREQYKAFSQWCYDNPHRGLNPRLHQHSGPIEHGGYIADPKTAAAFAAWQAARTQQPAKVVPDGGKLLSCPVCKGSGSDEDGNFCRIC